MTRALVAEFRKLKRAHMPLWTALVVVCVAGLAFVALPALGDPNTKRQLLTQGGTFAKAVKEGLYDATWTTYLRVGTQSMTGSWGLMTFGLIASFLFVRETKDGTVKEQLALPVRREYYFAAKMAVLAIWVLALSMLSVLAHAGAVSLLHPTGFSWSVISGNVADTVASALLLYLTLPFTIWFALRSRGYLAPLLFTFVVMAVSDGIVDTALSRWWPWNMSLHMIGASWYPVSPAPLPAGAWLVAFAAFGVGVAACLWQLDTADAVR